MHYRCGKGEQIRGEHLPMRGSSTPDHTPHSNPSFGQQCFLGSCRTVSICRFHSLPLEGAVGPARGAVVQGDKKERSLKVHLRIKKEVPCQNLFVVVVVITNIT